MSIAFQINTTIPPPLFPPPYCPVLNTTGAIPLVRRQAVVPPMPTPAAEAEEESYSSSSSSSIGEDSDFSVRSSENDDGDEDNEAESLFKQQPLQMESLEKALPIRRGISNFYNGKSKSFTSVAEASIEDIAKPENAFSRRRRNLLASKLFAGGGSISKRPIGSSRSSLALAVAMSSSDLDSSFSQPIRPPLHRNGRASRSNFGSGVPLLLCKYPAWRSRSLVDIQ